MIPFHRIELLDKEAYTAIVAEAGGRGCEYSFANLYLWGKQEIAFLHGCVAFFSHFYGNSLYPYPIGSGDRRAVIQELIRDARARGIPCRLTSVTPADREELETWFPGQFVIQDNRDSYDYVYDIHALADLKGRKMQKKRNHFNRFTSEHPNARLIPLSPENMELASQVVESWYQRRVQSDPHREYGLEQRAIIRGMRRCDEIGFTGAILMEENEPIAMTMATRLSHDTMDVHFEKAREEIDGAYGAINCLFARYIREQYPEIRYLNREDDMGIPGLRKAKLSYNPDHMVEKGIAYLLEDYHED